MYIWCIFYLNKTVSLGKLSPWTRLPNQALSFSISNALTKFLINRVKITRSR